MLFLCSFFRHFPLFLFLLHSFLLYIRYIEIYVIEWLSIPFHLFAHARAHGLAINNAKATTFLTHFVFFFIFSPSLFSHTFPNSPYTLVALTSKNTNITLFFQVCFLFCYLCVCIESITLSRSVCIWGWGIFLRVCALVIFAAIVSIVLALLFVRVYLLLLVINLLCRTWKWKH